MVSSNSLVPAIVPWRWLWYRQSRYHCTYMWV